MTATSAWSIVEHHGRAGLLELEADWRRLYAAMPLRTSYHVYEAHLAYVDHLMAAPDELRCLALRDRERVRAICLLEAKEDHTLGPSLRVWQLPFLPLLRLRDIVCPEDEARREFIPVLAAYLRRQPHGRRLLELGPLPEKSVLWDGLRRLGEGRYCTEGVQGMHVLDCSRPFEELMSRLSKKFRSDLRRRRRKLDSLADVRFVTVTEQADLAAEFETLLELEASGWKGAAGSAIRLRREWPAFFRSLLALQGGQDYCEIHAIYVDGRCIASQLCLRTGGEYAGLKTCYDEGHSRTAPGLLLLERTVQRCCKDPDVVRMNWLNASAWQRPWSPDLVTMQRAYVAVDPWTGRPLIALLRFRLGYARRFVRWMRTRRERFSGQVANRRAVQTEESPSRERAGP